MDGALMNLMLNGIEAMRGTGGELIVISKRTEHGRLMISVTDTGVGVPVTDAESIFEAFFTVKPQGAGLGLSISRRMIESQSGSFADQRQHGTRTIFRCSLPAKTRPHEFVRRAGGHRRIIANRNSTMRWSAPID
jgi:signal transduction histidine kinase